MPLVLARYIRREVVAIRLHRNPLVFPPGNQRENRIGIKFYLFATLADNDLAQQSDLVGSRVNRKVGLVPEAFDS